jgi:hypothetical protein
MAANLLVVALIAAIGVALAQLPPNPQTDTLAPMNPPFPPSPANNGGGHSLSLPSHILMPWLCLERCGFNTSQIESHIDEIAARNAAFRRRNTKNSSREDPLVNVVAFELFNLGPNSSLVVNDLYPANDRLKMRLPFVKRFAMISSYPYPPEFLSWMRTLFRNSSGFLSDLKRHLLEHDIHGVNIDFEPRTEATEQDAQDYADFLQTVRRELASVDKFTSVAAARWNPIWNLTAIAMALRPEQDGSSSSGDDHGRSLVDYGFATTMNTYTFHESTFERELMYNIQVFNAVQNGGFKAPLAPASMAPMAPMPPSNGGGSSSSTPSSLVVGLETWPGNFTVAELDQHFDLLAANSICQIAVWDMPIQEAMWMRLERRVQQCL